jgi:hypothetical protein
VIDFDLNLPTNDESTKNEEPTISLDFDDIQKTDLNKPNETNVNENIPIVEEKPVEEKPVEETIVEQNTLA